jgi:hypothetical protein
MGTGVPVDSDLGIRTVDGDDPLTAFGMRSLVWHAVPRKEGAEATFVVPLGPLDWRTSTPASWRAGGGVGRMAQPARITSMSRAGRCMRDLRERVIAWIDRPIHFGAGTNGSVAAPLLKIGVDHPVLPLPRAVAKCGDDRCA